MGNSLATEKKVRVVSALLEGSSIRGIERMTGINRNTIMSLGYRMGQQCGEIMHEKMRDLPCKRIEVDELWAYVYSKQKNVTKQRKALNHGDVWTWIALDPETKLIPSYLVGQRDAYHARAFMEDLASRLRCRVQISSDGYNAYESAIERGFGSEVDYGQVVKVYSMPEVVESERKYSPPEIIEINRKPMSGQPVISHISTSHVEKYNHTLRMHNRRMARLTNAFSKKLENFKASIPLHFVYYNFIKTHTTLKMTPAMAAGIENSYWTIEELLERCGES
jgi:IS1 family transposase